jgi:hypothetical protein
VHGLTDILNFFEIIVVRTKVEEVVPALVEPTEDVVTKIETNEQTNILFRYAPAYRDFLLHCEVLKSLRGKC